MQLLAPSPQQLSDTGIRVCVFWTLACLLPWLLITASQEIRYAEDSGWLFPLWSIATLGHGALLIALLWRHQGRQPSSTSAVGGSAGEESATRLPRRQLRWIAAIALGAVLVFAVFHLATGFYGYLWIEPIAAVRADMLPLMQMALNDFWRDGIFPYRDQYPSHWPLPLTFTPGLWLPYSLPYFFKLDLRVLSVAGLFGLIVVLGVLAGSVLLRARRKLDFLALVPILAPIGFLLATDPWKGFFFHSHLSFYWLAVGALGLAVRCRMPILSGVLLGLCATSRPYFVILVPLCLIFFVKLWRGGRREDALKYAISAAFTAAAILLPFVAHDAEAVFYGPLIGYGEQLTGHLENNPVRAHGFGLTAFLLEWDLFFLRNYAALGAVLIVIGFAIRGVRDEQTLLEHSAAALFAFLYFSLIPWEYTFVTPLLLLAAATPLSLPDDQPALPPKKQRLLSTSLKLGVPLLLASGFAFFGAHQVFNPPQELPDIPGGGGSRIFSEARYDIAGLEIWGWVENNGWGQRPFRQWLVTTAVPCWDPTARVAELEVHVENLEAPLEVSLVCKGTVLGRLPVEEGGRTRLRYIIPPMTLNYGLNTFMIGVRTQDEPPTEEQLAAMGLELWRIQLLEPRPRVGPSEHI